MRVLAKLKGVLLTLHRQYLALVCLKQAPVQLTSVNAGADTEVLLQ